jgi:RimJ/RimL family protein N-acetyltransferase
MQIRSGDVTLRAFDASLSGAVYAVRNHASVRVRLRDPRPIEWGRHEQWVRENLLEARRLLLFVVLQGDAPVGIALLRNIQEQTAEIGVMVVEAERRPLVAYKAAHLIGWYGFELLDLKKLFSYVPIHNARALTFNLRCGFVPTGEASDIYQVLVLTRQESRAHPTHRRFRVKYGIELVSEIPGAPRSS